MYYVIVFIIGASMLTSLCISSYLLYKSIRCGNKAQYSCEEKCMISGHCDKHKFTEEEKQMIEEKIKSLK